MTLTLSRATLLAAVLRVASVGKRRKGEVGVPVCLLEALGEELVLSCGSTSALAVAVLPSVSEPWSIQVSVRALKNTLQTMVEDEVTLEVLPAEGVKDEVPQRLLITTATYRRELRDLSPRSESGLVDFPDLTGMHTRFTVDAQLLRRAILAVSLSVAEDGTRPLLQQCQMKQIGMTLRLATTDGYRLTVVSVPILQLRLADDSKTEWLVPGATLRRLTQSLSDNGEVTFNAGVEGPVVFEHRITQTTVLAFVAGQEADGSYPNIEQLLPTSETIAAEAVVPDTDLLLRTIEGLRRSHSFVVSPCIALTPLERGLELYVQDDEMGNSVVVVPADVASRQPELAGATQQYNINFLIDALKAMDGKPAAIKFNRKVNGPGAVVAESGSGPTVVLMPMHQFTTRKQREAVEQKAG